MTGDELDEAVQRIKNNLFKLKKRGGIVERG